LTSRFYEFEHTICLKLPPELYKKEMWSFSLGHPVELFQKFTWHLYFTLFNYFIYINLNRYK